MGSVKRAISSRCVLWLTVKFEDIVLGEAEVPGWDGASAQEEESVKDVQFPSIDDKYQCPCQLYRHFQRFGSFSLLHNQPLLFSGEKSRISSICSSDVSDPEIAELIGL